MQIRPRIKDHEYSEEQDARDNLTLLPSYSVTSCGLSYSSLNAGVPLPVLISSRFHRSFVQSGNGFASVIKFIRLNRAYEVFDFFYRYLLFPSTAFNYMRQKLHNNLDRNAVKSRSLQNNQENDIWFINIFEKNVISQLVNISPVKVTTNFFTRFYIDAARLSHVFALVTTITWIEQFVINGSFSFLSCLIFRNLSLKSINVNFFFYILSAWIYFVFIFLSSWKYLHVSCFLFRKCLKQQITNLDLDILNNKIAEVSLTLWLYTLFMVSVVYKVKIVNICSLRLLKCKNFLNFTKLINFIKMIIHNLKY